MLYINLSNMFYQNTFIYFKISNNLVEVTSTTFSSFALFFLLLVSLGLTFHNKGTTVHKVLGLLLTSIFVVFLWMLQSQFLFIYVVYILAFISAVLMLFLSVVLMLPISTLTAKNTLTDHKNQHKAYFFVSLIAQEDFTISMASITLIVFLFFVVFLMKYVNISNVYKMYVDLFEYSQYYFQVLNQISSSNCYNQINDKQAKFNLHTRMTTSNHLSYNTFTNVAYQLYLQIGRIIWKSALNLQLKNTGFYVLALCLVLTWTAIGIIISNVTNSMSVKIKLLHYKVRVAFQLLKANISLPQDTTKLLWDVVVQTYLFITVVVGMSSLFLSKQVVPTASTSMLSSASLQGLGQIKTLLYGDFSLFLLFSTFVLLIALLGAAVMTRSKR